MQPRIFGPGVAIPKIPGSHSVARRATISDHRRLLLACTGAIDCSPCHILPKIISPKRGTGSMREAWTSSSLRRYLSTKVRYTTKLFLKWYHIPKRQSYTKDGPITSSRSNSTRTLSHQPRCLQLTMKRIFGSYQGSPADHPTKHRYWRPKSTIGTVS